MRLGASADKVLRDIWDSKRRSLLVVLTLAIGIGSVGMINNTVRIMKRDIYTQFNQTNPSDINIYASPFPKEVAASVAAMRDVWQAEARLVVSAKMFDKKGERHDLRLYAAPDFKNIQVNRIHVETGASEPELRTILIEKDTARMLKLSTGDPIKVEMTDGTNYELTISGVIHDMSAPHYNFSGDASGYVSLATLKWMGIPSAYNMIVLTAAPGLESRDEVIRIASEARQDMERLFDGKVFLEVFVKVKSGWTDDERLLKSLGYE